MRPTVTLERPAPSELAELFRAVGWKSPTQERLSAAVEAYTATVCARQPDGRLVGYASVFSDGCLTTLVGELAVHPDLQRQGIGGAIMRQIEAAFPRAPIYVSALGASDAFFRSLGFRLSTTRVTSMFKRPASDR